MLHRDSKYDSLLSLIPVRAFFEEFAGSGSWMDLGGYDTNIDIKQLDLLSAITTNKKFDGASVYEYMGILSKVVAEVPGDTTKALLYRTALAAMDTSFTKLGERTFMVNGMNEAEVAARFNVPQGYVSENYMYNEKFYNGAPKNFIITFPKKEDK